MSHLKKLNKTAIAAPEGPRRASALALLSERYTLAAARIFPPDAEVKITLREVEGEVLVTIENVPLAHAQLLVEVFSRPPPGLSDAMEAQPPPPGLLC